MSIKVTVKFNRNLDKYKKGDIVEIELNGYWRNRIKDGDISSIENERKNENQDKNQDKGKKNKNNKENIDF